MEGALLALVSLSVCGHVITSAVSAPPVAALHIQIMCSPAVEWLKPGFHLATITLKEYMYTFDIKFDITLYVYMYLIILLSIGEWTLTWGKTRLLLP